MRIISNRCQGWHQPVVIADDGTEHKGARWPTWQEALDALRFHAQHGKFPSEVEEKEIPVCGACGQPLPEESK